jgi:acetolactate synthase-1/2/3 large subunit
MVRQWQEMFYEERYSHVDLQASPDYVKLAEAYGGIGIRVETPEQFRPAMEKALQTTDRPIVIDCVVPTEENVYPMIPSGQSIDEMRLRSDLEHLKATVHADAEDWSFSDEEKVLEQYVEMTHAREGKGD